jgi:hypothetical protein
MYGGGPVVMKACTAFAATATTKSPMAKRPAGPGSRSHRCAAPSRNSSKKTAITASTTQWISHDQT